MAQIVIAAVSAAITVGEMIYRLLHQQKPLAPMQDRQVSSSADGAPIPFGYGKNRFAGELIWCPGIEFRPISQGGASAGGSSTVYLYGASFAVTFGEGPGTILRIWADAKLIYLAPGASQAQSQIGTYSNWDPTQHYVAGDLVFIPGPGGTPSGVWECVFPNINQTPGPTSIYWTANTGVGPFDFDLTYNAGDLVFFFTQEYASIQPNNSGHHPDTSPDWWTPLNNYWKPPTIYRGTQTQNPDPLVQSQAGVDFTPAFRPLIYAVWDLLPLANFGNRIPNIRAEVLFTKTNNHL